MKSDQAFPSRYLKASDFAGGKRPHLQVAAVISENVGREDKPEYKPVMHVRYNGQQMDKGIVINQTNWAAIATDLGDESDLWIGHTIEFFAMRVQGPNGMVDGIRCRVIHPTDARAPAPAAFGGPTPQPPARQPASEIPGPFGPQPPQATPGAYTGAVDPDVPF